MAFKGITAFILNNGEGGGGGGGTSNYNELSNKPQINGNELSGNKTAAQLGLLPADTNIPTKLSDLEADTTHRTVTDSEKQSWNNKVDSVAGKGLSTNDYTDEDKTALANKVDKVTGKGLSTNDYTDDDQEDVAKVDGLVSSVGGLTSRVGIAEGKVRTLEGEMLSVQNSLDTKVDKVTGKSLSTNDYSNEDKAIVDGVTTALSGKVDKEAGKGLSTNDYSNADKAIVDGVSDQIETVVKDTVGWVGKNRFDPNSNKNEWVTSNNQISTSRAEVKSVRVNCSEGDTLTLSNDNIASSTNILLIAYLDSQDNVLSRTVKGSVDKFVTATAPSNTVCAICSFYTWAEVSKAQLEKSSVAKSYEPYHESVEQTLRDAEVIKGKNLIGWKIGYVYSSTDGSLSPNTHGVCSEKTRVTEGQKFIGSKKNTLGSNDGMFARTYDANGNFVGTITVLTNAQLRNEITIPANIGYIGVFQLRNSADVSIEWLDSNEIMFYDASESDPTYEPYYAPLKDVVPQKADTSTIAPTENGTTVQKSGGYAVGSHAIRNRQFITWKNAKAQGETINDASDYTSGDVADELDRIDGQIAIIEKKLFPPSILYAFHIDRNESDPLSKVRYLEDCAGYSPAYMDFQNGIFHYGSWSENEFFMPRPCMLRYNGTVDYYLAKHDYTKKADGVTASDVANTAYNGNAMLEFGRDNKKIWYKVVPDSGDDSSFTVYISDGQVDEDFHCWSFINNQGYLVPKFYLSIYNGSVISDVMRSLSGQAVSKSLTGTQEREKARANNQTSDRLWDIECLADYQLLELLTWLIGKSTDSQAVFGKGLTESGSEAINNDFRTGVQNAKGLFFGTNSGAAATYTNAIKVFGKENLWGFQWRRLNGWCMNDGVQKIKLTKGIQDGSTATDYNDDGTNYLNMGSTPSGSSGGYVSAAYSNNKGIVIPKIASGNSVSHYCDGLWFNNSGARMALVGGDSHNGTLCGVSCAHLYYSVSAANWSVGASLSCKPLA